MANDIGTQTGTNGSSMALNNQKGHGAMKPNEAGNHNPGKTKPEMSKGAPSPIAK